MKQTGLFIVVQRRRGLGKFLERQIEKAARISASRGFWARCEVHNLEKEVKKGGKLTREKRKTMIGKGMLKVREISKRRMGKTKKRMKSSTTKITR